MARKKKNKDVGSKWVTLYRPANLASIRMIEEVYKTYKQQGVIGDGVSLSKFVLLSAVRDVERTLQMSMAMQQSEEAETANTQEVEDTATEE